MAYRGYERPPERGQEPPYRPAPGYDYRERPPYDGPPRGRVPEPFPADRRGLGELPDRRGDYRSAYPPPPLDDRYAYPAPDPRDLRYGRPPPVADPYGYPPAAYDRPPASYDRYGPPPSDYDRYDRPPPRPEPALPPQPSRGSSSKGGNASRANHAAPKTSKTEMSAPSSTIICLNLPQSADETILRAFLEEMGCRVDEVTIIKDRETGHSKRFGFVRFASVEHARSFIEPNFPAIEWKTPKNAKTNDDGTVVKIDYSQTEKPGQKSKDVRPQCASDHIVPTLTHTAARDVVPPPRPGVPEVNDGGRDWGTRPGAWLIIRGLDTLTSAAEVGDQLVRDGMAVVRTILVKDRSTKQSMGFAFVIFRDSPSAAAAMRLIFDKTRFPDGVIVRNKKVKMDFAHVQAFRPAASPNAHTWTTDQGKHLQYWDTAATIVIWENSSPPEPAISKKQSLTPSGSLVDSKPVEDDAEAFLASVSESVGLPSAATSATFNDIDSQDRKSPLDDTPNGVSSSIAVPEPTASAADPEHKRIVSKKAAPDIAKWNSVDWGGKAEPDQQQSGSASKRPIDQVDPEDPLPYGNPKDGTCLLCRRKLKDVDQLIAHNEKSPLHQTNLADPAKVEAAVRAKAELVAAMATSAYKDRAAERREHFGQPDRPVIPSDSNKRARQDDSAASAHPAPPQQNGLDSSNVGMQMLQKSGWTDGTGLGQSAGRVEPVEAKIYQAGVGLGAANGTAISQQASNAAWNSAETGREKARERFNEQS